MGEQTPEPESLTAHVARLIEQTKDMDYDPSQQDGVWICGDHGIPECDLGECPSLPWPEPNADAVLAAFTKWAREEFLRVVKPYDDGKVPEMPEEAFRAYAAWEWPVGDMLERLATALPASLSAQTEEDGRDV